MIVIFNLVFSYSKSLLSSSADKVTTERYNLQSVLLKTVGILIPATAGSASLVALLVITPFSDQFKVKETSQLIDGMSTVLQKLL